MPIYAYPAGAVGGGGGGGGSSTFAEAELPVTAPGQTAFVLPVPYLAGGLAVLAVNGIVYAQGTHYTIAGTALTWLDVPFTLSVGDDLIVEYQTS